LPVREKREDQDEIKQISQWIWLGIPNGLSEWRVKTFKTSQEIIIFFFKRKLKSDLFLQVHTEL
jgi:hypothetical protein